nr:hypothetical protein [Legionella jordanis]
MLDLAENYHDFRYGAAFEFAHEVREAIINNYFDCIIDFASDLGNQISKPQKNTILHDFIENIINDHFSVVYFNDSYREYDFGNFKDIIEGSKVIDLFSQYEIKFIPIEQYLKKTNKEYFYYCYEYLRNVLESKLTPILKVEVFNLLFDDRELMKEFNILIANDLEEKTKRCTRWPKWLERALFCREKGRCAFCKKDISSLLNTNNKPAIDHIVPIALNGTNDPTNLQMLCNMCNTTKRGDKIFTSNSKPLYW